MRNNLGNSRRRRFPLLVVETNQDHQLLIQYSLLTSMPLADAVFVSTADEALAYLQLAAGKRLNMPHIVLLDIFLPDTTTGWQLLNDIRRTCPRLPIVILTGTQDEELIEQAYTVGANVFMLKPSDLESWERSFRILSTYCTTILSR